MKRCGFAGRAGRRLAGAPGRRRLRWRARTAKAALASPDGEGCAGKDALSVLVGVRALLLGAVAVRDRQPVRLKNPTPMGCGVQTSARSRFAPPADQAGGWGRRAEGEGWGRWS